MTSKVVKRGLVAAGTLLLCLATAAGSWAQGIYYREVAKDGRIYVFAVGTEFERWDKSGETGKAITRLNYGPNGETVVFDSEDAINLYNFKHEKPGEVFKKEAPPKPPEEPSFKIAPTIFTDFTHTDAPKSKDSDGNEINANAFNVGRAYLNLTGKVAKNVQYRVTADIKADNNDSATDKALSGSQVFRLKYAFVQFNVDGITPGSWVRLGMQHTPTVDFQEQIYRYRFQGTVFAEREGYLTSSDYAVAGRLMFPKDYGDIHIGIYNGDGYTKLEANNQKALQARVAFRPFPKNDVAKGLRLVGFVDLDKYVKGAKRNRYQAAAYFEHPRLNAGFEYLSANDQNPSATKPEIKGQGFSIWATPISKVGLEGLFRYDSLKPDKDHSDGRRKRLIVGAAYWFKNFKGAQTALLADFENVKYDSSLPASLVKPEERRFSLHSLVTF